MDPDEELARRLREEARAEAEEIERVAAARDARSRSFRDVAVDLRDRGDVVVLHLGDRTFRGAVTGVGTDVVSFSGPPGTLFVRLGGDLVVEVVEDGGSGEPVDPAPVGSFRAVLRELELAGTEVEVGGSVALAPVRVATVATDHVVLADRDGRRTYVGLDAVSSVLVRREAR